MIISIDLIFFKVKDSGITFFYPIAQKRISLIYSCSGCKMNNLFIALALHHLKDE